jgi:hypothetical protein
MRPAAEGKARDAVDAIVAVLGPGIELEWSRKR